MALSLRLYLMWLGAHVFLCTLMHMRFRACARTLVCACLGTLHYRTCQHSESPLKATRWRWETEIHVVGRRHVHAVTRLSPAVGIQATVMSCRWTLLSLSLGKILLKAERESHTCCLRRNFICLHLPWHLPRCHNVWLKQAPLETLKWSVYDIGMDAPTSVYHCYS